MAGNSPLTVSSHFPERFPPFWSAKYHAGCFIFMISFNPDHTLWETGFQMSAEWGRPCKSAWREQTGELKVLQRGPLAQLLLAVDIWEW